MEDTEKQIVEAIHAKAKELYKGVVADDDYSELDADDTIALEESRAKIMSRCVKLAIDMYRATTKCSCIWGPSQGVKT